MLTFFYTICRANVPDFMKRLRISEQCLSFTLPTASIAQIAVDGQRRKIPLRSAQAVFWLLSAFYLSAAAMPQTESAPLLFGKIKDTRTFGCLQNWMRQLPNLPWGKTQSTVGVRELNFCVRYENRWDEQVGPLCYRHRNGNITAFAGYILFPAPSFRAASV